MPFTPSDGGRSVILDQRSLNIYREPTPQGPVKFGRYSRPALEVITTLGTGGVRATFQWGTKRITVSGQKVYEDSTEISSGTISATGPVRFAFSDDEVVLVAGGLVYLWFSGTFSHTTDPDLPTTIIDVLHIAGRFIYLDGASSQFMWSDVGDSESIDGLAFATEAEGEALINVGGAIMGGQIAFFSAKEIEWWDPVDNLDDPFVKSAGRHSDKGLAAIESVRLLDNTLFFIGSLRVIYRVSDVPERISDFVVEDDLRKLTPTELAALTAYAITFGGHEFYVVNLPTTTWAFDISQKTWDEWSSSGRARFRPYCSDELYGLMGDTYSGRIYGFDGSKYADEKDDTTQTDYIERLFGTFYPLKEGTLRCVNVVLRSKRGAGGVAQMRYSDDDGNNWSAWANASLGAASVTDKSSIAVWRHLGTISAPGRMFEFRCTAAIVFAPYQVQVNVPRV